MLEQISYKLKYKGIKIGSSIMTLHPEADLEGKEVILITFDTDTAFFDDLEKIYIDKISHLPIRVERDIKHLGRQTFITEEYNQRDGSVTIYKKGKDPIIINKGKNIQNPISMIFHVRSLKSFDRDTKIPVTLPLLEIETGFERIRKVKVPAGRVSAFLFRSNPDKFSFWLSNDERKLPLKFKVPGVMGYSASMKEVKYIPYEEHNNEGRLE